MFQFGIVTLAVFLSAVAAINHAPLGASAGEIIGRGVGAVPCLTGIGTLGNFWKTLIRKRRGCGFPALAIPQWTGGQYPRSGLTQSCTTNP